MNKNSFNTDSDENEGTKSSRVRSFRGNDSERRSLSNVCQLTFPVPRIKAMLKVHHYAGRVSEKSAVFLAAALEYLTAEIIELSLNVARSAGRTRIKPKHIQKALKTDPDLKLTFKNATIPGGVFIPFHVTPLPVRVRDEVGPTNNMQDGAGPTHDIQDEAGPSRAKSVTKSPRRRRG